MKIKEKISQHRRDFRAIYECEHCEHEEEGYGYDDKYYHEQVIPEKTCTVCNKKAPSTYRPLTTKYPETKTV